MAEKNGKTSKFRSIYDADFKNVVVKYALQTSNKAASYHFGINESNVRRWKKLTVRGELLENPAARRAMLPKKSSRRRKVSGKSRKRRRCAMQSFRYLQEDSSDLDSMPLQQRLSSIATNSTSQADKAPVAPTLKSQPLSPTKLKVTRHSTPKPSQQIQEKAAPVPVVNEEVCLRWNSHHANMQTAFPNLLSKEQYCDVTLVADGKSLKCHKLILSSCSSYFDQVLEKIMPYQHPVIFMKDIPFNILKALCDFMYAGEVNILQNDLNHLLAVAESLKIKGLANKSDTETANVPPQKDTEQATEPTPKPSKVPPKASTSERKNPFSNKEVTDPLDLLQPAYEEEAPLDSPPPALKRNDQARRSSVRRVKKRKHIVDDHEPSPPIFRTRKGTRSRPNVKVPRYFNASFDNSNEKPPADTSTELASNEDGSIDPFTEIMDEIKTEPVDIEDGMISFGEESFDAAEEETPATEEYVVAGPSMVPYKKARACFNSPTSKLTVVTKQETEEAPDPLNVGPSETSTKEIEDPATENTNEEEDSSDLITEEPSQDSLLDDSSTLTDVGIPLEIAPSEHLGDHKFEEVKNQITLSMTETFGVIENLPDDSA